jgi:hypothetical protein
MLVNQQSDAGPALAFISDLAGIAYAWKGVGNNQLNVAISLPGAIANLGPVFTSGETTSAAPSLAAISGSAFGPRRLFIAWKGAGNNDISVAELQVGANAAGTPMVLGVTTKLTIPGQQTDTGPRLLSFGGELYLSFKGVGNNQLNVMSTNALSANALTSFQNLQTLAGQTTDFSPVMAGTNGRGVFIGWPGIGNGQINVMLTTGGSFYWGGPQTKFTSPQSTDAALALAYIYDRMYFAWKGIGNNQLNIQREDGWQANTGTNTLADTTSDSPALCSFQAADGTSFIALAWKGNGNQDLNIAQFPE